MISRLSCAWDGNGKKGWRLFWNMQKHHTCCSLPLCEIFFSLSSCASLLNRKHKFPTCIPVLSFSIPLPAINRLKRDSNKKSAFNRENWNKTHNFYWCSECGNQKTNHMRYFRQKFYSPFRLNFTTFKRKLFSIFLYKKKYKFEWQLLSRAWKWKINANAEEKSQNEKLNRKIF